jgi:hypothetical protein
MSDDTTLSDVSEERDYPVMEIDMRLFSVYVEGTTDETLDDVEEKINRQVEERLEEVKSLKRHDQELAQEYAEGEPTSARRHTQ